MKRSATLLPLLPLLLLFLLPKIASAQSLLVYDVDPSGFPTISAGLSATESGGSPMLFDPNDLEVIDNGEIAESVVIDCPPDVEEAPFYAVLVNDRSGSMMWPTASGKQRIELLKRDRKSTRLNSSHLVISYA